MSVNSQAKLIIVTAPSGAGKTTIVKHLLKTFPNLAFSVSATTRPIREGETNGKDYYFISEEDFRIKILEDAFLEYEEVYAGRLYGTLLSEVDRLTNEGKAVLFDIDVKGALNIKQKFGAQALSIFIKPPSVEVLIERLKSRQTDSIEDQEERIRKMNYELSFADKFDTTVLNDKLETALKTAEKLVRDFLNT